MKLVAGQDQVPQVSQAFEMVVLVDRRELKKGFYQEHSVPTFSRLLQWHPGPLIS